jgi:flagellar hook-basal body protein
MQNSLLVGLSRQMSLSHQIDILANNIANIDTTGFKADTAVFSEYLMPGASDGDFSGKDNRISFVQDTGTWIDFSPGTMQRTGDPLDVAINGKGFFQVQTSRGPRYTRNGAFAINAQGQLVTSGGDLVLGTTGPINFAPTDRNVIISGSGMISTRDGNSTTSIQRGHRTRHQRRAGLDREIECGADSGNDADDRDHPQLFRRRLHSAAARRTAPKLAEPARASDRHLRLTVRM